MRKLILAASIVPCIVVLAGCPKKNDGADGDAAAEAAAVAVPAVEVDAAGTPAAHVGPVAKNSADVARFPGEVAVADDDTKLASTVNAMTSPRGGAVVASLKPGADVAKFAEFKDCYLVTFPDPKDASSTLMGWIGKEGFTAVVVKDAGVRDAAAADAAVVVVVDAGAPKDAGATTATCAAGQTQVILNPAAPPVCKKKCASDADCKGVGSAKCVPAQGVGGKVARVCAD